MLLTQVKLKNLHLFLALFVMMASIYTSLEYLKAFDQVLAQSVYTHRVQCLVLQ